VASPRIIDLTLAYQRRYNTLRTKTGAVVAALWGDIGNVDDQAIEQFVTRAVPVVQGAQRETARLLQGFVGLLLGGGVEVDADAIIDGYRGGVPWATVYERPGISARAALTRGDKWSEAMRIASERAQSTAEVDVAMAQRDGMDQITTTDQRVVGYRRTLTGASCALCATASTQRYHSGDLMPIHNRCDCGVAPIIGDEDPGQVINKPLLRDLRQAGKGKSGPYWENRRVTVAEDGTVSIAQPVVHDHGELGPVLAAAGDHFDGPSSIN
jgi:hypothetical protein